MIVNGLQRLGLLNSANYSRAEMPLDDACSLVADNNTGKTSLINALQFVLIADGTRMNFGEHSREASRRFYFPTNASYVLAQAQLPEGEVVIGCVGKGHAHDYEYFAYRGALDLDDFQTEEGTIVTQPKLQAHMATRGCIVYTYTPGQFSDGLYGRNTRRADHEPNFNLFRLEHSSYLGVFQTILTRTLRLDKLSSADVKRFLLEIFRHDLSDGGLDFQSAWDRAFAQVNVDRAQYAAADALAGDIRALGQDLDTLMGLRGKLIAHKPIIDDLLRQWGTNYKAERAAKEGFLEGVRQELDQLGDTGRVLAVRREKVRHRIADIEAAQDREAALAGEFSLYESRAPLEEHEEEVSKLRDALVTRISNAASRTQAEIRREIAETQSRLDAATGALDSVDDNLHLQLAAALDPAQASALARAAHPALLSLPPAAFEMDPGVLAASAASAVDGEALAFPGLRVDVTGLPAAPAPASREELTQQIEALTARLTRQQEELETALALEAARQERAALEEKLRGIAAQLKRYDDYQGLLASAADRATELQALLEEANSLDREITGLRAKTGALRERESAVTTALSALDVDNGKVETLRNERRDTGEAFDLLPHLPHDEWVQAIRIPVEDLPAALQAYTADCGRLLTLTSSLKARVAEVHAGGLTRFQGAADGGMEGEIQRMVNFVEALPHEAETLERAARQAVVEVSSALRDLRRSLDEMELKMREFNKLISQRRVSDLAVFKLELVHVPELVGAIDTLLKTSDLVDQGESFDLYNQAAVLDDDALNRAKGLLIREGQHNNGLKLENLFRLEFKVGKQGGAVQSFSDLEASASLGTILMAKLVIGLAMLHLMRDKRRPAQAVCYLDEAATLDPANQTSLIDAAREFGFALIFASPLPLTTARYCIPIDVAGGKNQIRRQRWQVIEPAAERGVPA